MSLLSRQMSSLQRVGFILISINIVSEDDDNCRYHPTWVLVEMVLAPPIATEDWMVKFSDDVTEGCPIICDSI